MEKVLRRRNRAQDRTSGSRVDTDVHTNENKSQELYKIHQQIRYPHLKQQFSLQINCVG